MEWVLVAGKYHKMLLPILATLFAIARIAPGERPELAPGARYDKYMTCLPRYVHRAVMMILEPAEAALRRLLVIVAHGHGWVFKVRTGAPGSGPGFFAKPDLKGLAGFPAFNMFDPLPSFKSHAPFYEEGEEPPAPARPFPGSIPEGSRFTPVSAVSLWRRLNSLHLAARDLEKTARRYARWKARRGHARAHDLPCRPSRVCILRSGRPPGWRKKWQHDIDTVLDETHFFACDALAPSHKRKSEVGWKMLELAQVK